MTSSHRTFLFSGLVIACALGLGWTSSCSESRSTPRQSYTVRGQVKVVDSQRHELELHHEAIPDFVDYSGKKSGMMSMTMPFAVDKSLAFDSMAVGDKLEFTVLVDWDKKPALTITKIQKLPPDTQLQLTP